MHTLDDVAENREKIVNVRFTDAGLKTLDKFRGSWSRSEYIRRALAYAAKDGMKGPEEPQW